MAAIQVTSANSNSLLNSKKATFRSFLSYYAPVGDAYSVSGITNPRIRALSSTRIVVLNDAANIIQAYDFNGTSWSPVGNAKNVSMQLPSVVAMSSSRICLLNATGSSLQTYDFDGTDWTAVGSAFSLSAISTYCGISALSSSVIALADSTSDKLVTYTFNGSAWSQTGNALTISELGSCDITALTSSRVAIAHNGTDKVKAYDWDGTNWSQVGSASSLTINAPSISKISSERVLVSHYGTSAQYVLYFDGSSWAIEQTIAIPVGTSSYTAICFLESGKFVFTQDATDTIQTYSYGSGGIPHVLSFYGTTIQISKGNGVNPTGWTQYSLSSGATILSGVSGSIDSNGVIHFSWMNDAGAASKVMYNTFNCSTNSFGSSVTLVADIGEDPANDLVNTDIAVDSNNVPHVIYSKYVKIGGASTYQAAYKNKTGGSWQAEVSIGGGVKSQHLNNLSISMGINDIPIFTYTHDFIASGKSLYASIGNANNCTGLANVFTVTSGVSAIIKCSPSIHRTKR